MLILPACGVEMQKAPLTAQNLGRSAENQQGYFNGDKARETQKDHEKKQGSLWVDSYSARLYENIHRASRVGDTVTIIVSEQSSGKDTGNTNTSKKNDQLNTIGGLGGLFTKLTTLASIFNPSNLIQAKTDSKFEGKGTTEQKGELYAKLTATVTEVLNNGNLVIRGDKHIRVNKDDQILVVEGVVRPYDIAADNTIASTAIADARVTYSGFGVVAERQKPGWLTRALDYIWPF
ncbi:MAG: flagellar basal body L-ring protein FlgH [Deltaproteobacteria bacterium]|nr:flagellar basal body L-ring protein FlgH [Deltaproteobacteria bacterium]